MIPDVKGFSISATWSAPTATFYDPDSILFGGKEVNDVLLGISKNHRFVGYSVLASYGIFDIFRGSDIAAALANYPAHIDAQLAALADNRADNQV